MQNARAGAGYVGFSRAVLLSQHNLGATLYINAEKVALIYRKLSAIEDVESPTTCICADSTCTPLATR